MIKSRPNEGFIEKQYSSYYYIIVVLHDIHKQYKKRQKLFLIFY